jgi:hypothetical protein
MPNLDLITVPSYLPQTPYHHIADQAPIDALITRIDLLNDQVDIDAQTLRESIGTQGTLSNRLAQSLNDDGSIKSVAIDNALHLISEHLDGGGYVRMTLDERAKLSMIADNATNFGNTFDTISGILSFSSGRLNFGASDTITWRYQDGKMYADNDFPSYVRHTHSYNVNPVPTNLITPDYINYKTTSISTPYRTGSLRVYLNGIRLSENVDVDVPIWNGTDYVPTTYSYTEGTDVSGVVTSGLFALSSAISADITIFVDFDILY